MELFGRQREWCVIGPVRNMLGMELFGRMRGSCIFGPVRIRTGMELFGKGHEITGKEQAKYGALW